MHLNQNKLANSKRDFILCESVIYLHGRPHDMKQLPADWRPWWAACLLPFNKPMSNKGVTSVESTEVNS